MITLLKRIFGSSDERNKIIDGAVRGLDAIVYTDEEKAAANKEFREWYIRYLEATQPQNLSRRLIAVAVVVLWAFLILYGVVTFTIEWIWIGSAEVSEFTFNVLTEVVAIPFGIIISFYFAAHVARAVVNKNGGE